MAGIDEKLTGLDPLPLPVEDTDLLYAVRNNVSYKTTVGDLPSTGGNGLVIFSETETYVAGELILGDSINNKLGAIFEAKVNNGPGAYSSADWSYYGLAGASNTVFGQSGLPLAATGTNNVAVGVGGLAALTTGTDNIAIGSGSLAALTTGADNIAIGSSALASASGVTGLVAIGYQALKSNTANSNTAIGYQAMFANTVGTNNVALGIAALYANISGGDNTAIGQLTLLASTTGSSNTAIGRSALSGGNGSFNSALGREAGAVTTGSNNTFVGYQSGSGLTSGSYNTYLGTYLSTGADQTASNQIIISDGQQNIGIKIPTGGAALSANKFLATPNGSTGPASPRSIMQADLPPLAISTAHTANFTVADNVVNLVTTAAVVASLPPIATAVIGQVYEVQANNAAGVQIAVDASDTGVLIAGVASPYTFTNAYQNVQIYTPDNSIWLVR